MLCYCCVESKRHKKSMDDSDNEGGSKGSEEFLDLSSSSEHEATYDSDKDPVWNPFGVSAVFVLLRT